MTICSLDVLLFLFGNQSVVPCPVLMVASWRAYRFLKRQVRWSGGLHLLKNFPQFVVIHTVQGFGVVKEAEVNVFLELSCFSMIHPMLTIWSLVPLPFLTPAWTSGSSWFMYCWSLAWRILNHYFASVWDECNCAVVWAFFGIAFLWDWNENWPFPAVGHWVCQICWHIECSTLLQHHVLWFEIALLVP